jgi:uncharacterized protein YndB with AHSA1/START domain
MDGPRCRKKVDTWTGGEEMTRIRVETVVDAPIEQVWAAYVEPEHIVKWNAASDDWHSPRSTVDLRVGGRFSSRMEARDGSMGFDFEGTWTRIIPEESLQYRMDDGRVVDVEFVDRDSGVWVVVEFDPEEENPRAMQLQGWQAILNNFRRYVEGMG